MLTLFVASVLACQALSAPLTDNGIANQELSISGNSTLSSSLIANGSIYAVQYDGREDQVELILITVDSASALTGTKLIGDKFVPAGDVSFTGDTKTLSFRCGSEGNSNIGPCDIPTSIITELTPTKFVVSDAPLGLVLSFFKTPLAEQEGRNAIAKFGGNGDPFKNYNVLAHLWLREF